MCGRVHSFQSLGAVDGPGLRYVVFLQGCPLKCPYCHNPDTWAADAGRVIDADAVTEKITRARAYLDGVTISGGEPLMQAPFTLELLKALKRESFHTALDTSGCVMPENLNALVEATDIFLLDLKMNDDESYLRHIGIPLGAPMAFLNAIDKLGAEVWIRQVIVPGIHDRPGEMKKLAALLHPYKCIKKVELLPFKKLCEQKYARMSIAFPFADMPETPPGDIERLKGELKGRLPHLDTR